MDREGRPHTNQLHTLERFTRTNFTTLRYELTVDDPGAYTAKWTGATNLQWEKGTELFEYVCQQSNYAGSLMLGAYENVDRTTLTVPSTPNVLTPNNPRPNADDYLREPRFCRSPVRGVGSCGLGS